MGDREEFRAESVTGLRNVEIPLCPPFHLTRISA